jgi:chromosome segregation ATPase
VQESKAEIEDAISSLEDLIAKQVIIDELNKEI